ncbi:hypothetical protein K440DRAFT_662791 [Wilcoxina mikolae CBS 423.85]|nr:hypothetical protein K440DRAFT_662791 [Wilcoxina mikolae CBS 423.85]
MESFFAQFPDFEHNPFATPTDEFERLQTSLELTPDGALYKHHRRNFLVALVAESNSPVHRFFVETHEFPSYNPSASPEHEFEHLVELRQWSPETSSYQEAREEFDRAFQKEFGSDVLDFFEGYRELGFDHNPQNNHEVELNRLRLEQGWSWVSSEWIDARDAFFTAVRVDFNETFGRNDDDIEGWQFLCKVLGVKGEPPGSAEECQEAVKDIHTNIFDLLEYVRRGCPKHQPLRFFATEKELSEYSYKSDPRKIYPSERARIGALKFVLRGIGAYRNEILKNPNKKRGEDDKGNQPGGRSNNKKKKRSKKRKATTQGVEQQEATVETVGYAIATLGI